MKILLLEDDVVLSEIIEEYLIFLGYEIFVAYSGHEAEDLIYQTTFDLFLFDVNVPDINGFKLLENVRNHSFMTPTIFITSLDDTKDLEKGFSAGCDDYIKKPFNLKELSLRIDNLKRLYKIDDKNKVKVSNNIFYDYTTLTIIKKDIKFALPKKEAKIFEFFLRNSNRFLSIEEIIVNIWSYDETPTEATIRTYIKNIRKVVGSEIITTLKGVGYCFNKR